MEEENTEEIRELSTNKYHFKEAIFVSSLISKRYDSRTNLIDLGVEADSSKTLYQLMHMVEKRNIK